MSRDRLFTGGGFALIGLGAVLWLVGVAADAVGVGGQPGFNRKQIALAELGALVALAGVLVGSGSDALRLRWPRRRWSRLSGLRARLLTPESAVLAVVVVFIAVTAWWLSQDSRVPNGDSGRHLVLAHGYLEALRDGTLFSALANPQVIDNEFYPPVGHLVGALGALLAGYSPTAAILAENVVFIPLLALGCYGTGRLVFGRRAGALAVVFALSAPILVSQWHVFQLDAPQTATVSLAVWLLLLSERFGHLGYSALAGVAAGTATMIKVTSPLFLAGVVAVVLIRGGWRNWRGAAIFGLSALLISQPWLLAQEDVLTDRTGRAVGGAGGGATPNNHASYLRGALTVEYYLPLCVFFVIGVVVSTRAWLRTRRPDLLPELLAGVVAAYLLIGSMRYFDNRYIMPALVFVAVLGTGWIASLRRPARLSLTAALAVVFVLNLAMISTGMGREVAFDVPGTSERVVLVSDRGYVEGEPQEGYGFRELLGRGREQGAEKVVFEGSSLNVVTNLNGLAALAFAEDLSVLPDFLAAEMGPRDLFLIRRTLGQAPGQPCLRLPDSVPGLPPRQAIYAYRGGPPAAGNHHCP